MSISCIPLFAVYCLVLLLISSFSEPGRCSSAGPSYNLPSSSTFPSASVSTYSPSTSSINNSPSPLSASLQVVSESPVLKNPPQNVSSDTISTNVNETDKRSVDSSQAKVAGQTVTSSMQSRHSISNPSVNTYLPPFNSSSQPTLARSHSVTFLLEDSPHL